MRFYKIKCSVTGNWESAKALPFGAKKGPDTHTRVSSHTGRDHPNSDLKSACLRVVAVAALFVLVA